jgi:hypothetical protein
VTEEEQEHTTNSIWAFLAFELLADQSTSLIPVAIRSAPFWQVGLLQTLGFNRLKFKQGCHDL